MLQTIWKFTFDISDHVEIQMPDGAEVLHVDIQQGIPCIWALVDPERPKTLRRFRLFGTGHQIDNLNMLRYLGSFQMHNGSLVFHLFESLGWVAV